MTYDLLIKNGTIVDGSGAPRFSGDIGVREGKVAEVGRLTGEARRTVDADGLVVAPGIIDVHTHYDPQLTFEPLATSSVWHGVTTVVGGNCGFTLAPNRPQDRDFLVRMFAGVEGMSQSVLEAGLPWTWRSFPEFLATLVRRLGINTMVYVGHSALRRHVMGEAASERAANADELRRMKDLLCEGLAAGGAGFTTSLNAAHVDGDGRPVPSRAATDAEVMELASTLAETGAGAMELAYRSGSWDDAERRAYLTEMSRVSGGRPVLAGFSPRADDPDYHRRALRFLDGAAAEGGKIVLQVRNHPHDRPFNFNEGPTLETLPTASLDQLPSWRALLQLPPAERLARLRDPEARAQLRAEVERPSYDPARGRMLPPPKWQTITVAQVARPAHKRYEGRRVVDIAAAEGRHVADVLLDLALAEDLGTRFFYRGIDEAEEELYAEVLRSPHTMVGTSDGGAHLERDDGADWSTYFLRHWIGDRQILSLEEGISRLTAFPARVMGLADRGVLKPGYAADMFLFDPAQLRLISKHQVQDFPKGGVRYVTEPAGIEKVIVNGEVLVDQGRHTGAYPGKVLRPVRA
jgi:N-acyl-D-aspartate/D-glutamate deacylase